ncbi:MAG: hypothetical protein ISR55_04925 [Bacteroidetes bacterium]|nr:hypothetical protein [Bacteroidota bacterium]
MKIKEHKEYSKEGILQVSGQYNLQGIKTGIWTEYYANGEISSVELYQDGKLHGNYKSFHKNGHIWATGKYNHGCKEGKFELYDQDGNLILIQQYCKDTIVESAVSHH